MMVSLNLKTQGIVQKVLPLIQYWRQHCQCQLDDNTPVTFTIGSLNLNNFTVEKSTKHSTALAKIFGDESLRLDIIALQEIIKKTSSESPLENLINQMNPNSASCKWGCKESEYAGLGGKGKEHFGLLWRKSKVKHHETIQLDLKKLRNTYTRQPSVDILEIEEKLLAVINVHLKYPGVPSEWKKHAKRLRDGEDCCCHSCSRLKSEIQHLPIVAETAKSQIKGKCITPILIGDFNLEPDHQWFTELQKKYSPLNAEPTNYCKSLLRVYDNIWVEKGKAKSEPARVSGSSEEISNHKLVYSSVKITGQKGA